MAMKRISIMKLHCDYNWKPSEILKNEYLQGFDNQRIQNYTNSFNTLQLSHYTLSIPNQFTAVAYQRELYAEDTK
jgi:hypothetical protein